MSDFSIDELVIPVSVTAPGWPDFEAVAELRNVVETEGFGTAELNDSPVELLPVWLNTSEADVRRPRRRHRRGAGHL
ncbi:MULTISPECIES: hypothetical protein [Cryobacterium]|uniref:hypothetical protein n=1 Tax=Cryobacterium TaxID=69578 RepID=UPI0008C7F565|nr:MULTISPECIES: hypothetical protein [Cryobacterium]SEN24705.1 hypothetical protein SAMN05216281_105126 [Cryobacterium luteum]